MTNPTPHGQVPAIQRYKIGYHSDEWGVRSLSPVGIYDDAGPWVRYEDHAAVITALRTQQPAPATQKLKEQICISDTNQSAACAVGSVGTTSDAQMTRSTHDAPATQQAGEVRRAELVPGVMHCAKCKFQLNRVTLCVSDGNAYAGNNETEPCPNGCGPLWPVTWEQEARNCWKALEEMHERLHPAPTTQADSQPGDKDLVAVPRDLIGAACSAIDKKRDGARTLAELRRYTVGDLSAAITSAPQADSQPAPEYVGNGMFKGETIKKAAEHWANWCDRRCMNGLAEFLRVVAARAPADSVTAPAATPTAASIAWTALRDLTDPLGEDGVKIMGHVRIYAQRQYEAGLTEGRATLPIHAAGNVLEDAGGANWQDISTAPKDGTRFVAVGNNYGLYSEGQHTCIAQWFRGCWMEASDWNETSELKYLTHWMPLLPLPGSAARKQGGA